MRAWIIGQKFISAISKAAGKRKTQPVRLRRCSILSRRGF